MNVHTSLIVPTIVKMMLMIAIICQYQEDFENKNVVLLQIGSEGARPQNTIEPNT